MNLIGINGRIGSGKDTVGKIIQVLTFMQKVDIPYSIEAFNYNYEKMFIADNYYGDWQIKKFAYKLKVIASILTGIPVKDFEKQEVKDSFLPVEWNNDYFIAKASGLEVAPMQVRTLLQKLGTEAIRNQIHPNAWVNALFADYQGFTDARALENQLTAHPIWTKKIGDLHYQGRNVTLCGTPMLGNNYADSYKELDEQMGGEPRNWCPYCKAKASTVSYPNWIITDVRFENEAKAIKDRGGMMVRIKRPLSLATAYLKYVNPKADASEIHQFCSQFQSITITDRIMNQKGYKKGMEWITANTVTNEHTSETSLDNYQFDYTIYNDGDMDTLVAKVKDMLVDFKIL